MGAKGAQTTQQQTYYPNAAAQGAINYALMRGQTAAGAPFQQPVAPVAGFSGQQQQAFDEVGAGQGAALPFMQRAGNLFNQSAQGPDISQFFNPYAGAVGNNLKDIFGQQNSQTTGQLTQAAGGVGADRIAVGQSELGKQQDLTAGQTFANLFQPSLSAAQQQQNILQGAGFGMGALGPAAQNSVFQGAQALLGTGGLQQQENQAQLNAPYQNRLAQLAYPFQTSQFLGGLTGSLAPGLGGTTSGNTTYPGPSVLSQAIGAGTAGIGLAGYGYGQGPGSVNQAMNTGNTSISNDGPGVFNGSFGWQRGGSVNPYYDDGGGVPDNIHVQADPYLKMAELQELRADAGGGSGPDNLPIDVNDKPVNSGPQSVVPNSPFVQIQPHIPQLPSQSSGGSGGSSWLAPLGTIAGTLIGGPAGGAIGGAAGGALDKATGFRRGGHIDPKKFDGANPYAFAAGGTPDPSGVDDPDSPYNQQVLASTADVDARLPEGAGGIGIDGTGTWDKPDLAGSGGPGAGNPFRNVGARPAAPAPAASTASPDGLPARSSRDTGFAGSPWAALTAAGLGMMAGTSPFAGVNIGQGGMQGIKMLEQQRQASQRDETIDQAARRLDQEADFHLKGLAQTKELHNTMTPYQEFETKKAFPIGQTVDPVTLMPRTTYGRLGPDGKVIPIDTSTPAPTSSTAAPKGTQVAGDVDVPYRVPAPPGVAGYSSGAIDVLGRRVANGDSTGLDKLGFGRPAMAVRSAIQNHAIGVLTQEGGMSAPDAAKYLTNQTQLVHAQGMGLGQEARTAGVRAANLDIILRATKAAIPSAIEASEAVGRTGWVPINSIIQSGQVMASDPKLKAFGMANLQLAEHWARAMNPTGQMRESDRDLALKYLSTADSPTTYKVAALQLEKQIERERVAVGDGKVSTADSASKELAQKAATADPLADARAAIAKGAPRDAVMKRLQDHGIDASGL